MTTNPKKKKARLVAAMTSAELQKSLLDATVELNTALGMAESFFNSLRLGVTARVHTPGDKALDKLRAAIKRLNEAEKP